MYWRKDISSKLFSGMTGQELVGDPDTMFVHLRNKVRNFEISILPDLAALKFNRACVGSAETPDVAMSLCT